MQIMKGNKFVDCNPATAQVLGYDNLDDLHNIHPAECSPHQQPGGIPSFDKGQAMIDMAHSKGQHIFEWDHLTKCGTVLPVEVTLTSIEEGDERYLCSVWRDISDRNQALAENTVLESQLRHAERLSAIGQLAGGIAHDFNNLLQVIMGYCEMAQSKHTRALTIENELEQILSASKRSSQLVQHLLEFSHEQSLHHAHLDLDEVISRFTNLVGRVLEEHISFSFTPEPGLKRIYGNREQLEQVIMNLCVNSRDAMPNGGKLSLETSMVHLNQATCRNHKLEKPGTYAVLTVSDTGIGMTKATQEKIFSPFYTNKEEGKGTGLGLSTVYNIVREHKGAIKVTSNKGKGTTFTIYLPSTKVILQ